MLIYRLRYCIIVPELKKVVEIKKLLGNIGIFVVLNMAIKPGFLFIDNLLQNKVGHTDYGTYSALFSLSYLFSVLYDLGISQYSAKNLSEDNSLYSNLFPSLFAVRLLSLVFFPFLITYFGYLIGYEDVELYWLFILSISANLFHFALFFRAKLQAFQHFKLDSIASVLQKGILIVAMSLFFIFNWVINIEKYLIVELITQFLVFLILYFLIVKLFGWVKLQFNSKGLKEVVSGAFPFAVMTLLYSLNAKVDIVMLERMLNSGEEAGLYYGAVRLFDAGMMYPWVVMPMFFAKFASYRSDKTKAEDLLRVGTLVIYIPILVLSCIFFFESKPLFALFGNSTELQIQKMVELMAILGIAFAVHGYAVVYGTYLNASGYVKKVNIFVTAGLIINVVINAFFIFKFGALVAAWSTVISTIVLMGGYFYLTIKVAKIHIHYGILIKLIIISLLLFIATYFFKTLNLSWLINWLFIGGFSIILVLSFQLYKKKFYQLSE